MTTLRKFLKSLATLAMSIPFMGFKRKQRVLICTEAEMIGLRTVIKPYLGEWTIVEHCPSPFMWCGKLENNYYRNKFLLRQGQNGAETVVVFPYKDGKVDLSVANYYR